MIVFWSNCNYTLYLRLVLSLGFPTGWHFGGGQYVINLYRFQRHLYQDRTEGQPTASVPGAYRKPKDRICNLVVISLIDNQE